MINRRFVWIGFVVCVFLAGCAQQRVNDDVLYQTSTLNALMEGVYDGPTTFGELRAHGDFGIGTFNSLDGEMIGFDGQFYQVKADGKAYPVDDRMQTPFSCVKSFSADRVAAINKSLDYPQFQKYLDALVPSTNLIYAFRIDGTFSYVKTRSVPAQNRPYPRLVEVVKHQPTFEFKNVKGTIVGYRLPEYIKGINMGGYHFHFLSSDRTGGGHLLECKIDQAVVKVDDCNQLFLVLPTQTDFSKVNLTTQKHGEVEKVER